MVQFDLLPYPPRYTPGNLQLFSFLEVSSPPLGAHETIPHPDLIDDFFEVHLFESDRDLCTIVKRDVFRTLWLIERRIKHVCS